MSGETDAVCKVIVLDSNAAHEKTIKTFCDAHNLIAVKSNSTNIMDVLRSNVDLGAIFLSEDLLDSEEPSQPLFKNIHKIRPELPIILRRSEQTSADQPSVRNIICTSYTQDTIHTIEAAIKEHIFNKDYPNALIRGIKEITLESLAHLFPTVEMETSLPYLIKDRIIFGEVLSLITLESNWCRGYMMLQTNEQNINDLVKKDLVGENSEMNFRLVNDVLSEVTNLIWGKIKNRFIFEHPAASHSGTQVPIIVNHQNRYITFGTDIPQLCFKYTLKQTEGGSREITLYQKFIFNLSWDPDKFCENQPTVDDLIDTGELEFF